MEPKPQAFGSGAATSLWADTTTATAYPSAEACVGACLAFPIASTLSAAAPYINMTIWQGDSFECRRHWAVQGALDYFGGQYDQAQGTCLIMGNFGGDVPAFTLHAVCGDACQFYCDEMFGAQDGRHVAHCNGTFPSYANCYSTCQTNYPYSSTKRAGLAQLTDYSKLVTSDTLECRAVYAGLAGTALTPAEVIANCTAASYASVTGACAAVVKSSTGGAASSTGGGTGGSSTGLSAATSVQVSVSVLLAACIAAFIGSRRV